MKKFLLFFSILAAGLSATAQRSAADEGDFHFETKKDDGNKKFIKYTAFNIGVNDYSYDIDTYYDLYTQTGKAYSLSFEAYNTFARKVSGSTTVRLTYFDTQDFFCSIDYSFYLILVKGLYIKPVVGYGTMYNKSTDLAPYIVTYGGDIGYLFKMKTSEGKRPLFLGLNAGYHGFLGTATDWDLPVYGSYTNSYNGGGIGLGLKLMWGPKPSSN